MPATEQVDEFTGVDHFRANVSGGTNVVCLLNRNLLDYLLEFIDVL